MRDDDDPDDGDGPRGPLPLTLFAAAGWSILVTLALTLVMGVFLLLRPNGKDDLASLVACQAAAYLFCIFLMLRIHAPDASVRDFMGMRRTSWLFVPIGALLGVAIDAPTDAIYQLIVKRWPLEHKLEPITAEPIAQKAMIGLAMIVVGPLVEEMFFRGALFQTVKKHRPAAVIFALGAFFALVHPEEREWIPIAIIGFVLAYLRWASGSILPCFALHAVFNGLAFRDYVTGASDDHPIPWRLVALGVAVTLTLLVSAHLLGRSSRNALVAQEMDKL